MQGEVTHRHHCGRHRCKASCRHCALVQSTSPHCPCQRPHQLPPALACQYPLAARTQQCMHCNRCRRPTSHWCVLSHCTVLCLKLERAHTQMAWQWWLSTGSVLCPEQMCLQHGTDRLPPASIGGRVLSSPKEIHMNMSRTTCHPSSKNFGVCGKREKCCIGCPAGGCTKSCFAACSKGMLLPPVSLSTQRQRGHVVALAFVQINSARKHCT